MCVLSFMSAGCGFFLNLVNFRQEEEFASEAKCKIWQFISVLIPAQPPFQPGKGFYYMYFSKAFACTWSFDTRMKSILGCYLVKAFPILTLKK